MFLSFLSPNLCEQLKCLDNLKYCFLCVFVLVQIEKLFDFFWFNYFLVKFCFFVRLRQSSLFLDSHCDQKWLSQVFCLVFENSLTCTSGLVLLYFFYNSKNLNCIGVLSFFLRSVHTFSWFLKSIWISDFDHAETGSGAKKWVVLRNENFFALISKFPSFSLFLKIWDVFVFSVSEFVRAIKLSWQLEILFSLCICTCTNWKIIWFFLV